MYRMISFLKGAAIGAGMMYLFDPVAGNRRRALIRDQFIHLSHKSCNVADSKFRHMQNRLYGTFAEARSHLSREKSSEELAAR
jgi:hypothetical protein